MKMCSIQNVHIYATVFSSSDKIKRREALDYFLKLFDDFENVSSKDLQIIFGKYEESLISLLTDESEINRNKASLLITNLITNGLLTKNSANFIFSTLNIQMGQINILEESEENRLQNLYLLESLIAILDEKRLVYLNYISNILYRSLSDNYPESIIKSCDIIKLLANLEKEHFCMFSNNFIQPLLKNLSCKKFKIRIKAINTLGDIFIYGDCKEFLEANNILRKCIFDIQQVRLELVTFGYNLACKMPDRYSYWPKILPLLLFGLHDINDEIKKTAEIMWLNVGEQYEKENKEMQLDYISFEIESIHNVGCCEVIAKSFYTMLQDIEENTYDWQADVRLQAIKLLSICVSGLRNNCIQYSDAILKLVMFSASDQDPRISSEAFACARSVGYYIPPDLYLKIVQTYICNEKNEPFIVLTSLLSTTPSDLVKKNLQNFLSVLSFSFITTVEDDRNKAEIFKVFKILLLHSSSDNFDCAAFFTLFYVADSLPDCEELNIVMKNVINNFGMNSVDEFYETQMEQFLNHLKSSEAHWTEKNAELTVFSVLCQQKGFENQLGLVSHILKAKLGGEYNALVIMSMLQSLENVIKRLKMMNKSELQYDWSNYVISEHIKTLLIWKKGKTSQSLRMAGMSYLNSIVQMAGSSKLQIFICLEDILTLIDDLVTDELPDTRALSCKFIELLLLFYNEHVTIQNFFNYLELMVQLLDDAHIKVRSIASHVLSVISIYLPYKSDFSKLAMKLVNNMAVYLMEENAQVKENVSASLKYIKQKYPDEVRLGLQEHEFFTSDKDDFRKQIESLQIH